MAVKKEARPSASYVPSGSPPPSRHPAPYFSLMPEAPAEEPPYKWFAGPRLFPTVQASPRAPPRHDGRISASP